MTNALCNEHIKGNSLCLYAFDVYCYKTWQCRYFFAILCIANQCIFGCYRRTMLYWLVAQMLERYLTFISYRLCLEYTRSHV